MPPHPQAQDIASHVAYEIDMFFRTIERLARDLGKDVVEDNRRIETALLHARVIYDFLFTPPRPDLPDVSARHFFDDPSEWEGMPDTLCPYLKARREQLNRSVPHLSYDRLKYEKSKDWDLRTVATELKGAWESFLAALPPGRQRWLTLTRPPDMTPHPPFTDVSPTTATTITDVRTICPL